TSVRYSIVYLFLLIPTSASISSLPSSGIYCNFHIRYGVVSDPEDLGIVVSSHYLGFYIECFTTQGISGHSSHFGALTFGIHPSIFPFCNSFSRDQSIY